MHDHSSFFKSTKDLLVIIGWTSPERNSFWWKDEKISNLFRLWPHIRHFDRPLQENFWKIYVDSMWNEEEYIPRYIMDVLTLQNFCNQHNIKLIFYCLYLFNILRTLSFHLRANNSRLSLE